MERWTPFQSFDSWEPTTSSETIGASLEDKAQRLIAVQFWLEDPPARMTADVALTLTSPMACTQTDVDHRSVDVQFIPNKDGHLRSVVYLVHDDSARKAFEYCYDKLTRLLSWWAFNTSAGFNIYGVQINDDKHQAAWEVSPSPADAFPFQLPDQLYLVPEYYHIMALYREGRSSTSPFYRLLCFFKILETWHKKKDVFGRIDRYIAKNGVSIERPKRRVTLEMLEKSKSHDHMTGLQDLTFSEAYEKLRPIRNSVAHGILKSGQFLDPDRFESLRGITSAANITDMIVYQILCDDLDLWEQLEKLAG